MSLAALQEYTFVSKYARFVPEKNRRETWVEAVERVRDMHIRKYPQIKEDIEWAFDQVKQKRVLGSQRAMQFGGKPIEKINARLYNCTASYCDRIRFFQEAFWMLLCGTGVGFSVQKHHVAKLPNFTDKKKGTKIFIIPDSIEGWADSLGVLLASYFYSEEFPEFEGYKVQFNYSLIRPEGSPLGSSSGKAPGPKPLKIALEKVVELLDNCIVNKQTNLRPIDAYDILMHISDAVLSGGVRRSATLALFSPDDKEMATAKTGNWFAENPQRGRSNNSALLLRNETTKEQFEELMGYVREFGEPGFIWSDSTECLFNPCVTKDTIIATNDGLHLVENLINKPFTALVEGKSYKSKKGFWKTGDKNVVELKFKSGRCLKVTENHKVMTTNGWKEAGHLTFEDDIVIHNHREKCIDINEDADYSKGYCLGSFLGDGNISVDSAELKWWGDDRHEYRSDALELLETAGWKNNHHKDKSEATGPKVQLSSRNLYKLADSLGCIRDGKKYFSKNAMEGSWNYLSGLIAGYFDADGTVAVNHKKGCSLRITSRDLNNLENMQIILNSFGIFSTIYNERYAEGFRMMPDGHGGSKEYFAHATHELCISCDNIMRFHDLILIRNKSKIEKMEQIISGYKRNPNRTNFTDKLVEKNNLGLHDVYDAEVDDIHAFDANSIYVHNCVEVALYGYDENGNSGWQTCNLAEINGRKCKTPEDFETASRAAAIIGTCQAGYTDFNYLGSVTESIVRKEALLGVSITGMMDNPDILFDPKLQRKNAKLILEVNKDIASKIGINPTARATCLKPSGTTSCILGTASGIHPHHASKYIRRSQGNYLEPPLQYFKGINPIAIEKSVWSANGTDEVIAFCIEVPISAKTKNDIDALTLLDYVKTTQQNWVMAGTDKELCVQKWLNHNVSNTISVREDEWDDVSEYIYRNRKYFAGISLLPITGDKDYPQAPFTAIYTPLQLVKMYGDASVMASGLIVDGLHIFDNNLWAACDAVSGFGSPIIKPTEIETKHIDLDEIREYKKQLKLYEDKQDWIRRAKQFAERYFDNDVKKMTYCLKDVSNWHYWCNLQREYKNVDFSLMVENQDNTKSVLLESGCSGGSCTLEYV